MIILLKIALIVHPAKNRPGQACRPAPKCILEALILTKLVDVDGTSESVGPLSLGFSVSLESKRFSSVTNPLRVEVERACWSFGSLHQRNPSKNCGSVTKAGSLLIGPAGKQIWVPLGRNRPSDRVRGSFTTRWKDTVEDQSSIRISCNLERHIKPCNVDKA